jgi:hypothetical protein
MNNKQKYELYNSLMAGLFNFIWFGVWLYIIFILHQDWRWILVPIIMHWSTKEDKK